MTDDLQVLLGRITEESSLDCRQYKEGFLRRRIGIRMRATNCMSIADYLAFLNKNREECQKIVDCLSVTVTEFFRDSSVYEYVKMSVIPEIIRAKTAAGSRRIRVWSAACATGQELYSIAMLFHEVLGTKVGDYKLELFGSDLNRSSLAFAQKGEYECALTKGIPVALLEKYFDIEGRVAKVKDELKSHTTFLHQDITEKGPENLDMVFCRNVLIYMEREAHEKLIKSFHTRLSTGGFLVLGKTESIMGNSHTYSIVNIPERVYCKIA